ncbi:NEL-type E3 ubiquitin ligase domain-containing protein [Pseudomonas sp. PWP3-1b2]|uniref:NEL-type E3 ubiquitin ligase domain-containing protein n=1 Tax=Pseudomonas sp. PWP3-1b2 TaxID=2804656 RepID=UPI003CE745B0
MVEPIARLASTDSLSDDRAQQQGPLMAGSEWSVLQTLDALRPRFDGFFNALDDAQKREYVQLQRAWINAQSALEQGIHQLTEAFKTQALASLRTALKTLTGQDIDPTVAKIHTRYLHSPSRSRRAADEDKVIRFASLTLWDAACMNYDGLTGWSYPERTGLADASYLDKHIDASAAAFIALVRRLDIGGQLRTQLDQALRANASIGSLVMNLADAEFEFALIDALNNCASSRVDAHKYQQVRRALAGQVRWQSVEEMLLFVPYGLDGISWLPQSMGLTGQYLGKPPGDSLSIPHSVFSVSGCDGAFSFFPNRPGGSLRHHLSHREACDEFYVAFQGFYRRGEVDWLLQVMSIRDCARLSEIVNVTPPLSDLNGAAQLLYALVQALPKTDNVRKIGYVRNVVQNVPMVSLGNFYIKRCRGNLQELANETPGFMPTMIEFFKTLISEIVNFLLIPVPGALKGLGRVRAFVMFATLGQGLIKSGPLVSQGEYGELLQTFSDLADLLISGRLHTRLATSVRRRHQRLYQQLSQRPLPSRSALTNCELMGRMLGADGASPKDLEAILATSQTSRDALNQVWDGAPASASLIEAAQRFTTDRLIDWVAGGADSSQPSPMGAFDAMAPLLTQADAWPVNTALCIENQQGQELRRYSKDSKHPATEVVTVTALENYQFAYATPRRVTARPLEAIVALLPGRFSGAEQGLAQHLADLAKTLRMDVFEALTEFAQASRSTAMGARSAVRRLLPDRLGNDQAEPEVVTQLRILHPHVSQVRVLEVLREHPLSPHQQTQLLETQLQPEALYNALRGARRVARREAIIDGLFHARRFDRQTQGWATEFAPDVLRELNGQALLVRATGQEGQPVPQAAQGRTVVVIDQRQGLFSAVDVQTARTAEGLSDFYEAIVSQLSREDHLLLGESTQQAVTQLRHLVARAMLSHRALDGSFYPARREIHQYASAPTDVGSEPDGLGVYSRGADRYVFIEGEYFKVAQAGPLDPWRIQHPALEDAYPPVLTHNGAGAWRHEWENPLTWEGLRPFYRLGPMVRALSPDAIEQIQQISGVTADLLRRVHVRNEPPPVILVETIMRFATHQRVKAGVLRGADFFDELLGEVGADSADSLVGRAGVARADQVEVLETRVAVDAPQMERHFFKALLHQDDQSLDPLVQVLQRQFTALTRMVAQDLVHHTTADERNTLAAGRVPLSMTPGIRWWLEYLRKTRAMEGVHLSAAMNEDSAKLILHTLPGIEGWPQQLRVELWERGHLRDSLGPLDGAVTRILEPVAGQYQAYIPQLNGERAPTGHRGEFLAVLLDSLAPQERQALAYTAAELTAEIGNRLTRHWEFAGTQLDVGRRPWYNPPRRLADGRIGYPLSGGEGLRPVDRAQVSRLRELFPAKTDRQALDLLENLSDSVSERDEAIDFLFRERDSLNVTLERWCRQGDVAWVATRNEAAERIRRCWRKEDSSRGVPFELCLDDLALEDLPALGAHFGHVMQLSVRNNRLQALPARFLRCFTALRTLHLDGNQLQHVPQGLERLMHLHHLKLSHNQIQPNRRDVQRLEALSTLTKLDLSHNPIGRGARLNVRAFRALTSLMLRNASLHVLPLGVEALENLRTFDLRDNPLRVLTESDLDLGVRAHRAMNLHGNQLSQATLDLLGHYRRQPGYQHVDFGLWREGEFPLPSVERWLVPIPLNEVPLRRAEWSLLAGEQMADRFFDLLWNLSAYPPLIALEHQTLRQDVTQRIWRLIDGANHDSRLQQILFQAPMHTMSGGNDGWLLCLNDIELAMWPVQRMRSDVETAGPDLLNYYRALRRLAAIDDQLIRAFPQQSSREFSARSLVYRIALASGLNLPLAPAGRFDSPNAVPRAESVDELRTHILREELGLNWPDRVKNEEIWVEFLERKYVSRFESFLGHYDRDLERALEAVEQGEMSEGAYMSYVDTIQSLRKVDETTLIAQLTQEEWTAFVID